MSSGVSPKLVHGLLSCTEANDSLNSFDWSFSEIEEFKSPRSMLKNVNSLMISPISNSGTTASQLSQREEAADTTTSSSYTSFGDRLTPRQARKQARPTRFKVRLFDATGSEEQENHDGMEVEPLSPEDNCDGKTEMTFDPFLQGIQDDLVDSVVQVLDDGYSSTPITSPSKMSDTNHEEVLTAMQCVIDFLDGDSPLQYPANVQVVDNTQTTEILDYCLSSEGMEDLKYSESKCKPIVFTRADNWVASYIQSTPRHQRPLIHLSRSVSDPSHLRCPPLYASGTEHELKSDQTGTSTGNSISKNPLRKSSRAQRLHFSPDYEYDEIRVSHSPKRTISSPRPDEGKENFHPNYTNRIKRPRNAFILYTIEHRATMARLYPNTDNREISKLLGEQWKSLSETEKMPYRQAANREMAELRYRYPNWKYSGSRGQEILGEAASSNRQKRRRYNKKTPTKTIEIRDLYVTDLFSGGSKNVLDFKEKQCSLLSADCDCVYSRCSSPTAFNAQVSTNGED